MTTAPVTTQGKEFALKALAERRLENAKVTKIDNSRLVAGSPMYFYCNSCGGLSDTLPEDYRSPPKKICTECEALKNLGWLE